MNINGGRKMHKKIKHIIVASFVIGAVSGILPANNFILATTKAYAVTYEDATTGQLSSLTITTGNNNELKLYDSYTGDDISLTDESDYYIQLKSARVIQINAEVKGNRYVVKEFTSSSKVEEGKDAGEDIDIDYTYQNIYLRTYKSEADYQEAYDSGDVTDCEQAYIIHFKRSGAISETEQEREYAYLQNIHLSNGSINFSKNQTSYDVNVDEDIQEITVKVTPDDDEDYIEINGISAYEEDDYEKTISLDKGNNTIDIYVEHSDGDNEEDTTYTLNIYRGEITESITSTTSNSKDFEVKSDVNSFDVWQRVDGNWRYIDGSGDVLKDQWWFDKNTEKNYYLKEDGYRTTGWFYNNNNWYYFNENGEMQTGWISINKNWYYLNVNGVMKKGWLEDSSGNWYYLDSSGAMSTGWIENSNGEWYYLDSTGKMIKNSTINGYSLNSNGILVN
jgi:glucan-binding YG repeat protein